MISQIIGAFLAVAAASIILESPKKHIFATAFVGALGWGVYLLCLETLGAVSATYISGLVISTQSHIFSRIFKVPVTIFFLPGFFPLFPGSGMYLAVYEFIKGHTALAQGHLQSTIQIAGMIALAIFTIDTVFKVMKRAQHIKAERTS
ncbi:MULTISPECIES: threonine/serine exporter family protein [Carnobacterium]|uniref:Threonine/serine exporter family protein n=1 Tax=Carnobacterium antarcticum TaxID=2126436 RepID=A0ABW4NMW0_9LACT|nr:MULTISPECIES: threonine/serine exporter family protein [unclassified Carnobacterium]ALV22616.1 Integral membrane protein [Carnobacterium sp. CP1]QQP70524.1 threonine/serine exporter family protein [Carnobacterium sp. CS13]